MGHLNPIQSIAFRCVTAITAFYIVRSIHSQTGPPGRPWAREPPKSHDLTIPGASGSEVTRRTLPPFEKCGALAPSRPAPSLHCCRASPRGRSRFLTKGTAMKLSVGDIVTSKITQETGRILRIVKVQGRLAYVVAVKDEVSGREIESLWRPRELKELRTQAQKYRTQRQRSKPVVPSEEKRPSTESDLNLTDESDDCIRRKA